MASGLRFERTPTRLGDSSPTPHLSSPSNKSFATEHVSVETTSTSSSTPVLENVIQRQDALDKGPLLKFRERQRSNYLKRRNSQAQNDLKKKRKFKNESPSNIVLPTRFLLGGNIADPLNLTSFDGKNSPQVTPQCSPVPTPKYKKEVEVVIPANIHDPLNLNACEDGDTSTPSKKKNRRKKRKRTESEKSEPGNEESSIQSGGDVHVSVNDLIADQATKESDATSSSTQHASVLSQKMTLHLNDVMKRHEREEIVSPVVPQDPPSSSFDHSHLHTHGWNHGHHHHNRGHFYREALLIQFDDTDTKKKNRRRKKKPQANPAAATVEPLQPNGKVGKNYRPKAAAFRYGNYSRYYGYRAFKKIDESEIFEDIRLTSFKREWFEGKDVLDIGCNCGEVTFAVAQLFHPKSIRGIDIDSKLIWRAGEKVIRFKQSLKDKAKKTPISLVATKDPKDAPTSSSTPCLFESSSEATKPETSHSVNDVHRKEESSVFPNNVIFSRENYVLSSADLLEKVTPEYDTILCLSVTKWIHLNWGDEGLKRFFKRIFLHLRPEGKLILEPQSWASYTKKHSITEETDRNFREIRLKPDKFQEYLLSSEVGFSSCQLIDTPLHESKGMSSYDKLGCVTNN
jgi:7SK snRNA methylphosphate capping enzyme